MQLLKNHTHIHGFEDYNIVALGDTCLVSSHEFHVPYRFDSSTGNYIINKDLPVNVSCFEDPKYYWLKHVVFEPELVKDNKDILNTAKKIFVHQSCTISRSLMAEKYKKSLNPYLSDAVVIPKPYFGEFNLNQVALFIHEVDKMIVMVLLQDDEAKERLKNYTLGWKLAEYATCQPSNSYIDHLPYNINHILDAELFYVGELLYIPNSQSWAMDVLTHTIPADKIVFEGSVQDSLSSETNQLDFDSLCSIKDMLESSDEDTVSAGLKSLSMMDWMHYPNSIKFILNNVDNKWKWLYNKACSSTSVKYMMKTIAGNKASRRTWWPGDFDEEIYEKDFELFKQLKCHYHHIQPDQIMSFIRSFSFMRVNSEGIMTPNIKQLD